MELIEILQALNACHGPSGSEGAVAGVQRWHPKRRPVGRIGEHASPVPIVPVYEIVLLDAAAFRTGQGRIRAAHRLGIRGTHTPVHAERPQERPRERSRPVRVAPGHDTAIAAVTSFWF